MPGAAFAPLHPYSQQRIPYPVINVNDEPGEGVYNVPHKGIQGQTVRHPNSITDYNNLVMYGIR